MGKLNKELREIRSRLKIGRVERKILKVVEKTGLTTFFDLYHGGYGTRENPRRLHQKKFEFKTRLNGLARKGLLQKVRNSHGLQYKLTIKGENLVEQYEIGNLVVEKPWRWDGKWRMVIFDIPEKKRGTRDELRSTLIALGFANIQRSAWIHPYECRDILELIRKKFSLGKQLRHFVVEGLDFDNELCEFFDLPR